MIALDTSVAVAAALPWHEHHVAARAKLPRTKPRLIAQVAAETYSVLTRLPPPQRVPAPGARAFLKETFALPPLVLSPSGYDELLDLAAERDITGGAIYDALVAAAAREAGATLLSLDRHAIATYHLLQIDYQVVS